MPDQAASPGAIASPLTLLLDAATRSETAVEVLSLSFTLDLGFFERTALGVAQALGARVTVVGDAGVVRHDPRAVRRAGRSYLAGLAACGGSFHPKLVVIAGDETATVTIGSGNLTMAGWQDNHEIWTVLHAGPDGCPSTIGQVAQWLTDLPAAVKLSPHVPDALARIAGLLRRFEATEEGPRLVSPIWGPIIDQLPEGKADELAVCCPFHDPGAKALAALVARYDPDQVTVAVQPALTVCDGPAIDTVLAGLGDGRDAQVVQLDTDRYRHGKLIEIRAVGRRWALTGSSNCSAAALLSPTAAGGNVELGLVTAIEGSLMPEGAVFASAALQAHEYVPRPIVRPSVVVLGAARAEIGLEVVLARPIRWPGHVDLSAPEAQPDTWERIGELNAGATTVVVGRSVEGGSRLRVVADSPDGPIVSNLVFVVDPERVRRRPGAGGGIRRETEPFDLFANAGLAARFVADLESLRAGHFSAPRFRTAAADTAVGSSDTATHVAHGNWEDYLDECAGRIGHTLLRFALGLPQLDRNTAPDVIRAEWDEDLPDEDELGLDEDDADDLAQAETAPAVVARLPALSDLTDQVRARYRNWAANLARLAPTLPAPERLLALRLILWTAAAGAWPDSDPTAEMAVIGKATEALSAPPAAPSEIEPETASLAAVALSILRAQAPRTTSYEPSRIFNRAAVAVAHLLPANDDRYIAEYTKLLDQAWGRAVDPAVIADIAAEIVQADPLADAIMALEEEDVFDAHRHSRLLHLPSAYPNPTMKALAAVGLAEKAEPVGAWAGTPDNWALLIWRRPDVAVVAAKNNVRRWALYRLTGTYTPRICWYGEKQLDRRFLLEESFGPSPLPAPIRALLEAVGLDQAAPPADCT